MKANLCRIKNVPTFGIDNLIKSHFNYCPDMKHLLGICAIFLMASFQLVAQDVAPTTTPASKAVLTLESDEVDYGTIDQGGEPLRLAKFKNTGTEPLIISGAKGSCGCTVPNWPKEPIMPGESSVIEIRYDTKRVGAINKTVTVTSNDAAGKHVIRVIGTINAVAQEEGVPEKETIFKKPN
ncbi:MAG: DUF1573 domain-containing protein [Saprospiraceae bacterium]|nr:DUF1573 domain-containing protein [Saprospiraceae bacterium]